MFGLGRHERDEKPMNIIKRLFRSKLDSTKAEVADWRDPNREESPMSCTEITFEAIDPALYGRLLHQAAAAGAFFNGLTATFQGVTLSWNYDEPSQSLHVTCTKKPFYASCDLVEQHVRQLVANAKQGAI